MQVLFYVANGLIWSESEKINIIKIGLKEMIVDKKSDSRYYKYT